MTWAGNLIRLARIQAGISQRELAKRAQTSQATLSAYESGRKSPNFDTLVRIIRAAGLDLRIQLAPADDHDQWMANYEAALPKKALEKRKRKDLAAINEARRKRGLQPVAVTDLVGVRG